MSIPAIRNNHLYDALTALIPHLQAEDECRRGPTSAPRDVLGDKVDQGNLSHLALLPQHGSPRRWFGRDAGSRSTTATARRTGSHGGRTRCSWRIAELRRATGYRCAASGRSSSDLWGLVLPESTVGKIISRSKLPKKTYRNAWRGKTRHTYDATTLTPFTRNEVDTKEILDQKGLPQEVYDHLAGHPLPRWHQRSAEAKP